MGSRRGFSQDGMADRLNPTLESKGIREHEERLRKALPSRLTAEKKAEEARAAHRRATEEAKLTQEKENEHKRRMEELAQLHHMKCSECGLDLQLEPVKEFELIAPTCENCGGIFITQKQIAEIRAHYSVSKKVARLGRAVISLIHKDRKPKEPSEQSQSDSQEVSTLAAANVHYMKCPMCGLDLHSERIEEFEIEAPVCEGCRGIFITQDQVKAIKEHYSVKRKVGSFLGAPISLSKKHREKG